MITHALTIVALVAVLLASLPSAVADLEDLDQADFFDYVMTGSDDYMVFITREDDPNEAAGEMLEEMWAKGVKKYGVKLRRVDCGPKEHRKMCVALRGSNIANNLRLITGASSPNPYTKKPMRPIIPYEGQASVRAFDKFIDLAFPALIAKTDSLTSLQEGVVAAASPAVGEQKKGTLVLLTDKSSVSAFFRQVCFRGKTTSQCAVVGKGSTDVYSALGVNNMDAATDADADADAEGKLEVVLPALFYVPAGAGVTAAEAVRFPGKLSDADAIVAWAKDLAPSKQTPLERAESQQRKERSDTAVHPVHTSIETFDAAMAAPTHADSAVVVAVMHKAAEASASIAGWGVKSKKKAEGKVKAVELRCPPAAVATGADGLGAALCAGLAASASDGSAGALVVVPPDTAAGAAAGGGGPRAAVARAPKSHVVTSLETALTRALEALPDDLVLELEEGPELMNVLVERGAMLARANRLMASGAGAGAGADVGGGFDDDNEAAAVGVSILLLSAQEAPSLVLRNIAATYRQAGVVVGFLSQPSDTFMAQFGNPPLPTLIAVYPAPEQDGAQLTEGGKEVKLAMQPYAPEMFGKLGFRGMTNFVNSVLVHTGLGGLESLNPELNSGAGGGGTDGGAKAPSLLVEGISEPEQWDTACPEGASVICIVALMPRSTYLAKEFQTAYASMGSLGAAAKAYKFIHVEASCRHEFLAAFGLSSDLLPGVVAYSPAKRRYAVFRGTFSAPAIKDFAITLRSTIPMSERPVIGIGCIDSADEPDIIGPLTDSVGEGDAEDMLAEIQREERERAAALADSLRMEAEAEQLRLSELKLQKELEEEAKRKKKNKKKKKKKKKDQEL